MQGFRVLVLVFWRIGGNIFAAFNYGSRSKIQIFYAFAFSQLMYLQTKAASNAPTNGPTIKIRRCVSPVILPAKLSKSAGASDLAGFTEVLVTGIETRWINASANPIAMPANPAGALLLVAPKMTNRNMNVITISMISAGIIPYPSP